MERQTFVRFLLSWSALQVHLLFVTLIAIAISLIAGEGSGEGWLVLAFGVVAYPSVLGLMWYSHNGEVQRLAEDVIERAENPDTFRRKRAGYRIFSLLFLFVVAAAAVWAGFNGWVLNGIIPIQYLGYVLLAAAVLGSFGVNIWYGGPLDPRDDARPSAADPENAIKPPNPSGD